MKRLLGLITLSLFLLLALIPSASYAETLPTLPLTQPDLPAVLPNNAITWPLLPNESVTSLASLFYPKNIAMQARFIAQTLAFNNQQFTEYAKAQQVTLIVIPELKSLSSQSAQGQGRLKQLNLPKNVRAPWKNPLQMSYNLKDAAQYVVNPKLVAAYENLVKRNEFLKIELQKLNDQLSQLQTIMLQLKAEAIRVLSSPQSQQSVPTAEVKQPNIATQKLSVTKPAMPMIHASEQKKTNTMHDILLGVLALLLGSMVIIIAKAYSQKQDKNSDLSATDQFVTVPDVAVHQGHILKPLDFSLTQSGFIGNMSDGTGKEMVVDWGEIESSDLVQEGEQILEEARIFVHIGRADEAVELLKAQIKALPKASLHHWLYLLDIFRDRNQKEEFLIYASQLHEHFNVMMPRWDNGPLAMVVATSLEQFSHIVQTLTHLWAQENGYAETKAYLQLLLTDNREKERMGFTMQVFQEIVLLTEVLDIREKLAHQT